MEHREAELSQGELSVGSAEDPARFLRELRQLRDGAGLGQAELAARAHYPCEAIQAAEAGPALPDLPVLSAYVRSCGGAVAEWEERWRRLTRSPAMPLLSVRTAGCSDAATAGARVGSVSLAADSHDPALIMAALSRVANGITAEPSPSSPSSSALLPVSASASALASASSPDAVAPERGSLFSAAPEPTPAVGVSAGPETKTVPLARSAPWADAARTAGTGGSQAPSGAARVSPVSPVSPLSRAADTRRSLPSKPVIAAIVILVCLIVILLALFS